MAKKNAEVGDVWSNRIVRVENVDPNLIVANPQNWRAHPKYQGDALEGILDTVGWIQHVIVNESSGFLLDGHLRVAKAIERGAKTVPVAYVAVSDEEEHVILASFDPIVGLAKTERKKLGEILENARSEDTRVQALLERVAKNAKTKYVQNKIDGRIDEDEDEGQFDPSSSYGVEFGSLWLAGDHRIMCGDATNASHVSLLMNGQIAQVLYTDPPYGVSYKGGSKEWEMLEGDEDYLVYEEFIEHLDAHLAKDCALYIWGADDIVAVILAAFEDTPFEKKCFVIWNKNAAQAAGASRGVIHYMQKHEICVYGKRRDKQPAWFGSQNEVTIWDVRRLGGNRIHPTEKPIELAERALTNSSLPGQICMDLFLGSGSSIIAAERTNRICYGMENQPQYVERILRRLDDIGLEVHRLE